jgi:hypothetical protein
MKRSLSVALTVLMLSVMILLLTAHLASAQESSLFYWDFIHVEIDVQENGDMLVTETHKYVFTAPHTNERYRWLPLDKVEGFDDVQVFEKGRLLPATTGVDNNRLWIRWNHELNPPESRTFVLKYRVQGGLHIYNDGDQVFWKAIFTDRAAPIQSAKATVRLPPSLTGQIRGFQSFGFPAISRQVDARTVEFVSQGPLPPGEEMEVQIILPHGILDVPLPAWQQAAQPPVLDRQQDFVSVLIGGLLGLIVLVAGLMALILLRDTYGRDRSRQPVAEYLTEPPRDLPAGVVGVLLDGKVALRHIIASILDLAQRGVIRIDEVSTGSGRDFTFHKSLGPDFVEQNRVKNAFNHLLALRSDGTLDRADTAGDGLAPALRRLLSVWDEIVAAREQEDWSAVSAQLPALNQGMKQLREAENWQTANWEPANPKGTINHLQEWRLQTDLAELERPHEQTLIAHIFGWRTERRLSELDQKFYSSIPILQRQLCEEVVKDGFFVPHFEAVRRRWKQVGIVGLAISLVVTLVGIAVFGLALAVCPGTSLVMVMLALVFTAHQIPLKTSKGAEEAAKWRAFKRYLQNIEKYGDLVAVKSKFEAFLPYAVAFGLDRRLIDRFAVVGAPAPSWWGSDFGPDYGAALGIGVTAPTPGKAGSQIRPLVSRVGVAPSPARMREGGSTSLAGMSRSIGTSLASTSAGLGEMLNSAAVAMTSRPPASAGDFFNMLGGGGGDASGGCGGGGGGGCGGGCGGGGGGGGG